MSETENLQETSAGKTAGTERRLDDPVSAVARLSTGRLTLRAFRPSDADAVFAYSSDPRIGHDAGWPPHRSLDDSLSFINDIASQGHVWAIAPEATVSESRPQGTVIGSVGLISDPARNYDKVLMLGYAIGARFWGKGYTTEAARAVIAYGFEELGLEAISCTCYPWNAASKRVIDKCGFEYECTRHLVEIGQDGIPEDFLCHVLTKGRWNELVRSA